MRHVTCRVDMSSKVAMYRVFISSLGGITLLSFTTALSPLAADAENQSFSGNLMRRDTLTVNASEFFYIHICLHLISIHSLNISAKSEKESSRTTWHLPADGVVLHIRFLVRPRQIA